MNHTWLVLLVSIFTFLAPPAEDVVEYFPSGEVQRQYQVNDLGERHGNFTEFAIDGTVLIKSKYADGELDGREQRFYPTDKKQLIATYDHGVLDGSYQSFYANGKTELSCGYKKGELHGRYKRGDEHGSRLLSASYKGGKLEGKLTLEVDGKVVTKQVWKRGVLKSLDGYEPFSRTKGDLIEQLVKIQEQPLEGDDITQARQFALHRLQVYRALCGLNWQDLTLDAEWSESCVAAAELCRRLGRLTHTPERPPNTDDDLYAKGKAGAISSNIIAGYSMAESVDCYMDDSDPTNVERVGHRRWCLNPTMQKTGFGRSGDYSAMWATDASGKATKGLDAVMFPPAGFVPAQMFSNDHAWSISPVKDRLPQAETISVSVQPLDAMYLPVGDAESVASVLVDHERLGSGPVLIFQPKGIKARGGNAYRCRISYDKGKSQEYDYVVEFVSDERLKRK